MDFLGVPPQLGAIAKLNTHVREGGAYFFYEKSATSIMEAMLRHASGRVAGRNGGTPPGNHLSL